MLKLAAVSTLLLSLKITRNNPSFTHVNSVFRPITASGSMPATR